MIESEGKVLYAVVARMRGHDGPEEIVGLQMGGVSFPCVSSNEAVVRSMFKNVSDRVKEKGARIIKMRETEEIKP